ncbi:hypothetical protein [Pelagihabitans pacificus]|nr:hypothetical protein [Pelagihabitans pacificus]
MKTLLSLLKKELDAENRLAFLTCLVISITIFFIIKVITRQVPL